MKNKYRELLKKESPNLYDNYESIMLEQFELFCKKQLDYGIGNISTGADLTTEEGKQFALSGLWFRMNDKIQRLKQLVVLGQPDEVGENIQDTYEDLSVYGIISQIVQRKKWAK